MFQSLFFNNVAGHLQLYLKRDSGIGFPVHFAKFLGKAFKEHEY